MMVLCFMILCKYYTNVMIPFKHKGASQAVSLDVSPMNYPLIQAA